MTGRITYRSESDERGHDRRIVMQHVKQCKDPYANLLHLSRKLLRSMKSLWQELPLEWETARLATRNEPGR